MVKGMMVFRKFHCPWNISLLYTCLYFTNLTLWFTSLPLFLFHQSLSITDSSVLHWFTSPSLIHQSLSYSPVILWFTSHSYSPVILWFTSHSLIHQSFIDSPVILFFTSHSLLHQSLSDSPVILWFTSHSLIHQSLSDSPVILWFTSHSLIHQSFSDSPSYSYYICLLNVLSVPYFTNQQQWLTHTDFLSASSLRNDFTLQRNHKTI